MKPYLFMALALISSQPLSAQVARKVVPAPEVLPNCTAEMRTPAFWVNRLESDPDAVLLTPERIAELNAKHHTRPFDTRDIAGDPYTIRDFAEAYDKFGVQPYAGDPLEIVSFPGDSLRTRFRMAREWVAGRKMWDRRQLPFTDGMKQELFTETDAKRIPDLVRPEYGILVRHTLHRIMPTNEQTFWSQNAWQDLFQVTGLETGEPVAILHRSKRGDWLYVRTTMSFGWVPRDNVAVASAARVREIVDARSFLMSLDHRAPVYRDRARTDWVNDLFMGAKIPLAEKTAAGYRVRVPVRGSDGKLEVIDGWVASDAAVSAGYQPFTRRNMIETSFRVLGRPYGWAGSCHERSCSELVRTVLKTFGIRVARGMLMEINYADTVYSMKESTPPAEKYRVLDSCGAGATLCGSRQHIVIYLGKVDGRHYVIHSNGYSYHDPDGTEIRVGRVSVNDMELEGGSDIRTITDISTFSPKGDYRGR